MAQKSNKEILSELHAREPIFHRREFGTSLRDLEEMIALDFWEIGASGRIYSRELVIATLLERYKFPEPHAWPCTDFALRELGAGHYILTYTLTEPDRVTRRSTTWYDDSGTWKIVFHQGTVVQ